MIDLGERIKQLRTGKGITQQEFAERIGITHSTISAYENGIRLPSYEVLIKIARLFNVTIDKLLGYTNQDLIDISGLSHTQRDNVQSMILTYKKFNELVTAIFDLNDVDAIEYYQNNDLDRFKESLKMDKK